MPLESEITYTSDNKILKVEYPTIADPVTGQKLQLNQMSRDALGRVDGFEYILPDNSSLSSAVSLSQSGMVIDESVNGVDLSTGTSSFTYDKAGRLTNALIAGHDYGYGFGTPDSSCNSKTGNNINAGKNYNRLSQTVDSVTTTYCYDMADRLLGSSNTYLDAPTYDNHGNTSTLGVGTGNVTTFKYDQSDRNVSIEQGSGLKTTYTRDAQDGIVKREVLSGGVTSTYYYGNTGGNNYSFMYTNNTTKEVIEKYITLPGGVLITLRPTETTNTLKSNVTLRNFSGHALSVLDGNGVNQTGVILYDPFGQRIGATSTFASANPSVSFANSTTTVGNQEGNQSSNWASSAKRSSEDMFTLKPIQMGARVYISSLGRFLSVDPVEGGTSNNYVYAMDPINQNDYSGKCIGPGLLVCLAILVAVSVASASKNLKNNPGSVSAWVGMALAVGGVRLPTAALGKLTVPSLIKPQSYKPVSADTLGTQVSARLNQIRLGQGAQQGYRPPHQYGNLSSPKLPLNGNYTTYDVYPRSNFSHPSLNKGRIVYDSNSGKAWYSEHYGQIPGDVFIEIH